MGKIINILGPHGVGKTTLQNYIRSNGLGLVFEGFKVPQNDSDFDSKDSYLNYEKKYFERIDKEHAIIKKNNQNGFVSRSFEEVRYFLLTSKYGFQEKEVDSLLFGHLKCDRLVYLDADRQVLKSRISGDELRDMDETKEWYEKDFTSYSRYYKSLPGILVIDTSFLTTEEVFDLIRENIERGD